MVAVDVGYRRCRQISRAAGTSYYWASWLVGPEQRRHVHALYGFCRLADDIVDDLGPVSPTQRERKLDAFEQRFFADLEAGRSADPMLLAVVHTIREVGIDPACVRRFLRSMSMDLTIERYMTFTDLLGYMDGSAAVIGEMMLPVLGGSDPAALGPARDLGIAFQLTNFLRDVDEDLDRGRVYLPQEDIAAFDAGPALAERQVTAGWVALMRFEIDRARRYYRSAEKGIGLLPARSARCVRLASRLYAGILERIEAAGYDVFAVRARVPTWRKLSAAAWVQLADR